MLTLTNVTLFAIDCLHPHRTLASLLRSMGLCEFAETVLLTDLNKFDIQKPVDALTEARIRLVHHEESDRKVSISARSKPLPVDYELAVMTEPIKHMETDFVLHHEWDSGIIDPSKWEPAFLEYDYIGAPWPPHNDPGWPPCDGITNAVGNGGFALKSRRFCAAIAKAVKEYPDDPAKVSSDRWSCRNMRGWLYDTCGVRFAPVTVASRFSCEDRPYGGQFGAHGVKTAEINRWRSW